MFIIVTRIRFLVSSKISNAHKPYFSFNRPRIRAISILQHTYQQQVLTALVMPLSNIVDNAASAMISSYSLLFSCLYYLINLFLIVPLALAWGIGLTPTENSDNLKLH